MSGLALVVVVSGPSVGVVASVVGPSVPGRCMVSVVSALIVLGVPGWSSPGSGPKRPATVVGSVSVSLVEWSEFSVASVGVAVGHSVHSSRPLRPS